MMSFPQCNKSRAMQVEKPSLTAVRSHPDWTPESWQGKTATQQPTYPDAAALDRALVELREMPPLVTSWEVLALKRKLADAAEGKCFMLQGGDCAESFSDCTSPLITNRLKVLLQMSLVLVHGLKLPVVRVGRFAGPVRQAAFDRHRDARRRDAAELSRRHHQPPGIRSDCAHARSVAAARRPFALGDDDELRPLADRRRLRRSASSGILGSRLGRTLAAAGRIQAHGRCDRRFRALHGNARRRPDRQLPACGFLYFARSAAAALRTIAHAPGSAPVGLVQPLDAFPVDRHAHRRARRRARRILPRHPQSDRHQDQPERRAGANPAPARRAQSRQRTRPHHADPSHGRRQDRSVRCRRS